MSGYPLRFRLLAICLSVLAGFVDAIGFLALGGYFVSFMSGNSTRLGVDIATGEAMLVPAIAILSFVVGAMAGALVAAGTGDRRKPAVLALVALLLATGAAAAGEGVVLLALAVVAAAMGASNAVFQRDGEVSIGVTYMTGALVKLGQRLAGALLGEPLWAWLPHALLWAGLASGALAGALMHAAIGLAALWIAAAAAALLAIAAALMGTAVDVRGPDAPTP
ncbi:YoaK family protein [Sphingomonas sp. 1P06PA]|uniref:YoaK family protein n=1 Tax=Sphingomonas sp. 1P06PA TaxID=554121 RepID=UPI0039A4785E